MAKEVGLLGPVERIESKILLICGFHGKKKLTGKKEGETKKI